MAKIIKPEWAFNSYYVSIIKNQLKDETEVVFDLSDCEIVDSEAIKLIFQLKKEGKRVEVKDPPEIYKKILKILQINV